MLSPREFGAYCVLAALQASLVALPRPAGRGVCRLRSPGWALVLPASLIAGTFGVLALPRMATGLALLAAVATPVLVGLAVIGVVRGSRWAWLAALPVLAVGAVALHSWPAALAASVLTALGCLPVGAALVRLTPLPWLGMGIAVMCIVDVVLLATGVGQPAAIQMNSALAHSALPDFHQAQLGAVSKDYPDLALAAVLGSTLAGSRRQLPAAVLVAVLVSANGFFFMFAQMLPGTVPLGVAAAVIGLLEWRGRTARRRIPKAWYPPALVSPRAATGTATGRST
jgi:hypothetical protein